MTAFSDLIGKTLVEVKVSDEEIVFVCNDGSEYEQSHPQTCCEKVYVEDICGDVADLIGTPILHAEEVNDAPGEVREADSYTWTFYHIRTLNGTVTIRWFGTSNGYYSEAVRFRKTK